MVVKCHPFFVLLFLLPLSSKGQFMYTKELELAQHQLLKLKIDSARHTLQLAETSNSKGVSIYLENYADVLSLLISQDRQLYNKLGPLENQRLSQLKRYSSDSPYHLFIQAEIRLQWAIVKLLFNEEIAAAWQIRQAYKLLEENEKRYPQFVPQQKTIGAIKIMISAMPEKYRWLMDLLGLQGSLQEGIERMQKAEKLDNTLGMETKILRQLINMYILNQEKEAAAAFAQLLQLEKDNLLIHLLYNIALYKTHKGEALIASLNLVPSGKPYYPVPYLWLLKGDAFLFSGNYLQAKSHYKRFLKQHKGENFIKSTYFKLFLTAWLNDQQQEATHYKALVINEGEQATEMDRYAVKFVSTPSLPHPVLMQARLFTDGGYLTQALDALKKVSPDTLPTTDKADFHYRKARIYHLQQDYATAIGHYLETIAITGNLPLYQAPNAALQLGYIYKEMQLIPLAKKYLKKAISYKEHEYKSSIDSKAKAALATMRK